MAFKDTINQIAEDSGVRFMTPDESKKLKKVLLENYLLIQSFCEANNLSVMLVGGSALGAVRHKGYIPWDDDLDIAMPRKDYNVFKKLFVKELGERFILDAPNIGKRTTNRFPRILIKNTKLVELGMDPNDENAKIKIDLFIIENIPQNAFIRLIHGFVCTIMMFIAGQVDSYEEKDSALNEYMSRTKEGRRVFNRRVRIGRVFSFRPAYKWFNSVDKVCQYKRKTSYLGIPTGRKHYFGEILHREALLPASIGVFEQCRVNLPRDPDRYLKNLYGDYMTIPDENNREKHYIYDVDFF